MTLHERLAANGWLPTAKRELTETEQRELEIQSAIHELRKLLEPTPEMGKWLDVLVAQLIGTRVIRTEGSIRTLEISPDVLVELLSSGIDSGDNAEPT